MQPDSSEGESTDSNRRESGEVAGHVLALGPDIAITYLPIPDPLRGLVMTLFHFRCDLSEMSDMFPAMTGFLSFTLKGAGWMERPDGQRQTTWPATLVGPSQAATRIGTDCAFHTVGAVLSPLGWARLTGLHAAHHSGAMYDAAEILGPVWGELAERLREMSTTGPAEPIDLVAPISALLAARMQPIDPRHAAMIKETGQWLASSLDPPIEELYRRLDYSDRQAQRLTERFFGVSPKVLVRKFRALRVFSMLLSPATSDAEASAVIDLYYDQSHLIREFRRFIGRTPNQLQAARMPILSAMVARRNYRAIWPEKPV